jgi:DNA-binding MarR family transcriptional regulator
MIEPKSASDRTRDRTRPTGRAVLVDMLQSLRSVGDEMTVQQLLTILFVSSQGAQSLKAVGESLRLRESTIAVLLPRLVARGLVIGIPNPSNPGEVAIILSTAGHRFVDNLLYRQGRCSGAFPRVPVTDSDLHRRNNEALHFA